MGATASWEIDFWGKFRRAVESEDANFLGSIAAYDIALVSLTADVARTYVLIRTLEERLRIARDNVIVQKESLRIAEVRFQGGATSERDVQQALTQLRSTEATIPLIQAYLRQAKNALCTLLGMPPRNLDHLLGGPLRHPGGPAGGRRRHPCGPAPPPAGYPQRRASGRRPKRPHRCRQGGPLPRLHPERDLRVPVERCG